MAYGADDHLMAPRRVRQPGVNQRKTGHRFHLVQQVEAPGDREPAEGQREKERQQQRQPEHGNREAEQREGADQRIGPLVAHYPRQHTDGDTHQQREAKCEDTQLHGGRKNLFQLFRNQLAVNAGDTEVPVQQSAEPELPGVPQRGALQRGVGRKIAQAEADEGQEKEGDQQQQQAAQGKNNHGFFTSSFFSRETPAKEALPNGLSIRPFIS